MKMHPKVNDYFAILGQFRQPFGANAPVGILWQSSVSPTKLRPARKYAQFLLCTPYALH